MQWCTTFCGEFSVSDMFMFLAPIFLYSFKCQLFLTETFVDRYPASSNTWSCGPRHRKFSFQISWYMKKTLPVVWQNFSVGQVNFLVRETFNGLFFPYRPEQPTESVDLIFFCSTFSFQIFIWSAFSPSIMASKLAYICTEVNFSSLVLLIVVFTKGQRT